MKNKLFLPHGKSRSEISKDEQRSKETARAYIRTANVEVGVRWKLGEVTSVLLLDVRLMCGVLLLDLVNPESGDKDCR